jgi:hypothetical protein
MELVLFYEEKVCYLYLSAVLPYAISYVIGLDNFGLDMDIRSEMLNRDIQFVQNSSGAHP